MEDDPLDVIGTTIDGKYEVVALAGQGGFSVVYRATHLVWDEPVALKFFTLLGDAKEELREKLHDEFVQEGKLMTKLSSKSAAIVQARDIGRFSTPGGGWVPYMVLEWIEGAPLDEVLADEQARRDPPRSIQEAVRLMQPGAVALEMAHRMGVAHRDIKPANFVVIGDPKGSETQLKVLDFGIAKVMSEQQELQEQLQLTGAKITSFTPLYGAPEQFTRDFGATGPWTDVFAMALILGELVSGRRALDGETLFELGRQSCDAHHRPTPGTLGGEVSDEVDAVFAKALTVRPADRFATMGEFWQALRKAAFADEATWLPPSTVVVPSSPSGESSGSRAAERAPTLAANVATIPEERPSSKGPVVFGAAAVMVLGGGLAFATLSGEGASAPAAEPMPVASSAFESPAPPPSPEASVTSEPAPSASTEAEEAPSAPSPAPPKPPPATPVPQREAPPAAPPPPAPPEKAGKDAWDPNSFGGR